MRPLRYLFLAILLALPAAARAADVPVVYTVDTTALKLAISGTNLTFELHTNAACTSLAHTQVLTVDNVSMLSVLKRSKPKNGVKPPKTTDLRATLTGVAPAAPLYAKVTGTGVTPVGGACQVQASTAAGPSGGGSPVVKDANGAFLGSLDVGGNVIIPDGGNLILGYVPPTGFLQQTFFVYTSTNCTGPPLTFAFPAGGGYLHGMAGVDGTTLYYAPLSGPLVTLNSSDYSPEIPGNCTAPGQVFNPPNRCCCTSPTCYVPGSANAGPMFTLDVSGFVPPFSASLQ